MVGAVRLAYCPCSGAGAYPPIIAAPDFSGAGTVTLTGQATSNCNVATSVFYNTGSAQRPCYSVPMLLYSGDYGITRTLISSVSSTSTTPFTVTSNTTAYQDGIAAKTYSCNAVFDVTNQSSGVLTFDFIDASVDFNPNNNYPCGDGLPSNAVGTTTYQTEPDSASVLVGFRWIGTAQRDLPGIRIQRASGVTSRWLVSVASGVVSVYREDGTDSYQTAGTLNQVVANINAALAGKITARVCGWVAYPSFGETDGNVASGKNEWDYVFTKNDPSTMLKDLGPTYIQATFCNDPLAPFGWGNSTRLPVYWRGDVLPPRGVVWLTVAGGPATIYLMNSKYPTKPWLKQYPNTEAGAKAFVTDAVYAKTQTVSWGQYGGPLYGFSGDWTPVLNQINDLDNQTKSNPGVMNYNIDIAPLHLQGGTPGETITRTIPNIVFLGSCDQWLPGCPDPTGNCIPDYQCQFVLNCGYSSGCYSYFDPPPCGSLVDPCKIYYEYVEAGSTVSVTLPSAIPFNNTTSFSVRIS